ncbi:hypothetical protein P9112_003176 [Eukaryota sp. TZLM1-RC]
MTLLTHLNNPFRNYCCSKAVSNLSSIQFNLNALNHFSPTAEGRYHTALIKELFTDSTSLSDLAPVLQILLQEDNQSLISPNSSLICNRLVGSFFALQPLFDVCQSLTVKHPHHLASTFSLKYASTLYDSYGSSSAGFDSYRESLKSCLLFHLRKGMSITKVASTPVFSDLFLLVNGLDVSDSVLKASSLDHVSRLYHSLSLEKAELSRSDFFKFGDGFVSSIFLNAVVQDEPKDLVSWNCFLNFCLALNFQGCEAGVRYIFKKLDVGCQGFLSKNNVYEILLDMALKRPVTDDGPFPNNNELVGALVDEIFDTCFKSRNDDVITVNDLIRLPSSLSSQLISTLIDCSTWV